MRIAPLGEGHRAAVEPAVDHVGHAAHPLARRLGRIVGHRVDIRLVDPQVLGQRRVGRLGLLPDLKAGRPRAFAAAPRRSRRPPCSRSLRRPRSAAACPSSARARGPNRRSIPENCRSGRRGCAPAASGSRRLLASISSRNLRRADEPALPRILDQRVFLGPPAERIFVQVLLLVEEQAAGLQVADDVAVASLTQRPW